METESSKSIRIGDAASEATTSTNGHSTRKSEQIPTEQANMFDGETDDDDDMMALVDLLNGLTADDPKLQERALALAEELIMDDDTEVDEAGDTRGVSADNVKREQEENDFVFEEIHEDNKFTEDLSQDKGNERKKTRKERKVKSDIYRQNGNICCSKNDYEEAVRCYTEALDLIRDSPSLYINRALANIQLGHYVEAIEDSNKAIFLSDKSLKARLYKAKALYLNGKQLECIACLEESRNALPAYTKQIDHCQMALFSEQGDAGTVKEQSDVFPGESFMRLAASYNVAKMSTFFEDSPLKRAQQKEN